MIHDALALATLIDDHEAREIEIIHRLQISVLEYNADVLSACDTSAELDWFVLAP